MKKEYLFLLAGLLLGYSITRFKKKRGRVIVDEIKTISKDEFERGRIGIIPEIY